MQRVALGKNGPTVSKLCFGTLTMSPLQKDMPPGDGAQLLLHAYELGVNFVDTADIYATYPHIREALKSAPDYVVSTKAYCWDEQTAREALERALRGINRDYVDLFMLHEQESIYTLRGHEEALQYLTRQKQAGKVRAVGVSTHHVACVSAATYFGGIDVIHPILNRRGLGIVDGPIEEMEKAVQKAHDMGIGIFAMKSLGGGHLSGDAQSAFDYVLNSPFVDSVAVGMQSIEEVEANVAAFCGEKWSEDIATRLARKKRKLMIHDWCEGCGRCAIRCAQNAIYINEDRAWVDREKCVLCGYCAPICPQFCIKVI